MSNQRDGRIQEVQRDIPVQNIDQSNVQQQRQNSQFLNNQQMYQNNYLSSSIQCINCKENLKYQQIDPSGQITEIQCDKCQKINYVSRCKKCNLVVNNIQKEYTYCNNCQQNTQQFKQQQNQHQEQQSKDCYILKSQQINRQTLSDQVKQKPDQIIYTVDIQKNNGQNVECLHCQNYKLSNIFIQQSIQNNCQQQQQQFGRDFINQEFQEQCQMCQQSIFKKNCHACNLIFLSKTPIQDTNKICNNESCPIGQQNKDNTFQETLNVVNYFQNDTNQTQQSNIQNSNQINQNNNNNQQSNQIMEVEEQKQDQICNNNNQSQNNRNKVDEKINEENVDQNQQIQQQYNYKKLNPQDQYAIISCFKCQKEVKLLKNAENLQFLHFKKEECNNCSQNIYYTFCECNEVIYNNQKFDEKQNIIECSTKCDKIQYQQCTNQIQNTETQNQATCEGQFKCSIKFDNEPDAFYRKSDCDKCNTPVFYFYCQCSTLIKQNSKPFQYGEIIECPNQDCHLKTFQLVRCPIDSCQQINMFRSNYTMGDVIKCQHCLNNFQQVTCPSCYDSLYFSGDYSKGNYVECPCNTIFQQVSCPHCYEPQFRIKDKHNQIFSSLEITCKRCKKNYYTASCSQCHQNIEENKLATNFKEGHYYKCKKCNLYTQWYICHNKHINTDEIKEQELMRCKRNAFFYGQRQCQMVNCGDEITLNYCPFCQRINKFNGQIEEGKKVICQYTDCQKQYNTIKCDKCQSLNSLKQVDMFPQCFQCKEQLENVDVDDPNKGLCKGCYTDKAEFLMDKCFHVISCEGCVENFRKAGKCPICRTVGVPKKLYF